MRITRLSQSHERFVCEEKYLAVVERNVHRWQDLSDRSGHLHFERFVWQTVGGNILFGRIERGMNLQLTSNQNLSYRTNTTNDFMLEIKPPIDVRDGDMYISVNKIFYPTTLSNINKIVEEIFFSFEIDIKNFVKDQYQMLYASGVQFGYLMGFTMPRCCATF